MFKKEYGKEMSREEAAESATNLLNFFKLLHKIDCRNKTGLTNKVKQNSDKIKA